VLVDAGLVFDSKRILRDLAGRTITAHTLTHAHVDHYGASHAVCEKLGIPLWVGANDVREVEDGKMVGPRGSRLPAAPKHQVDRALREGDEVAGFTVLDVPGHSPGHVAFWREADRALISGDVMWGYNPFLMRGGPREPFHIVSPDWRRNQESARRLAALRPELVCFGHGKPLRDPDAFAAAVAGLG
jgi:hydroxyacylglutathione hydrolase